MDRANHALARYLAVSGRDVHLVAHRVWPDLAALPGVTVAPRAAAVRLASARRAAARARRVAAGARGSGPGTRLLSNGGNTRWVAPTWIHYLHAAYTPEVAAGPRARLSAAAGRTPLLGAGSGDDHPAPAIICNSARTAADVRRCYAVDAVADPGRLLRRRSRASSVP